LLNVKIAEFRNSPLLVGQHFQVQVSITFQKSGVDGQLKPVVSLLPVDLYFLLLPHYGVFDRHTIKLTLTLWSSQGFPHSQGSFAWVVQVRASSSSATTIHLPPIPSRPPRTFQPLLPSVPHLVLVLHPGMESKAKVMVDLRMPPKMQFLSFCSDAGLILRE
jgi:hypothetical protein